MPTAFHKTTARINASAVSRMPLARTKTWNCAASIMFSIGLCQVYIDRHTPPNAAESATRHS